MCQTCGNPGATHGRSLLNFKGKPLNVNNRRDPTNTGPLVKMFDDEIRKRFDALSALIVKALVVEDVLGLSTRFKTNTTPGAGRWAFARTDAAISGFMDWLNRAVAEGVLGIQLGAEQITAEGGNWSRVYVESAYQSGMASAANRIRAAGASVADAWVTGAFRRPIHADQVALLYRRTFEDLVNVTDVMAQQMREALSVGMALGWGADKMAANLLDRVEKIGVTRARTVARTELISAYAESTLNTYDEANILGVDVEAEFESTADNVVCPICAALQGRSYTIEQARGMIPVHPNCRCAFLPKIPDATGVYLG